MTLGKYLKRGRFKHNLTQNQIASLVGMSQSTYSRIENDIQNPSVYELKRLFEVLKINADEFFKQLH